MSLPTKPLRLRSVLRITTSLAFLFATSAHAEELLLGVTSEYVYNSNFFSAATNPDGANSFLIGPTFELSDDEGRLAYDLTYTGAYQLYVDQSGVDAWESRLRGRATYEIDSRTSVRLTERFRDVSNLRFSRQDIALADTALDPNQDRYFRNDLELELIREFSRLLEFRMSGAHHWTDFLDNVDRNDSQVFELGSELRYEFTARHDVGVGAAYINQDFDQALSSLGSRVHSVNAFLSWVWQITDEIVLTANGGPSWIRSEEDDADSVSQTQYVGGSVDGDLFRANIESCDPDPITMIGLASDCNLADAFPPLPASDLGPRQSFTLVSGERVGEDSALTFFGGASLQATLASWNLEATYSRRQSTTSGAGLASSLDRFYLEFEFAPPSLRFSPFLAGSWDRRETLTESTVVDFTVADDGSGAAERIDAITTVSGESNRRENFTAIVGLRTAFTDNTSATLEFRYRRTEGRDRAVDRPSVDTYFAVLSFAYTLDPIRF